MKADIVVIGGGASGLMAAYWAAQTLVENGSDAQVVVLEKMPRPARKLMITGKGRCNFTNMKAWNEFSAHIRSKPNLVKSAFYSLTPDVLFGWFESFGMRAVVERGDRAFPESYRASDVVDTLVNACFSRGVKIECEAEVRSVERGDDRFALGLADGRSYYCRAVIVATGGLSYPTTGCSGDGYAWAEKFGHRLEATFPALTALVPKGYKTEGSGHIDRSTALAELGELLCGNQLKNVSVALEIEGTVADEEFGDIDFTDGGIEGPIGFQLSRKAVKAMTNGSRTALVLDLKPGVDMTELTLRVKELWKEIQDDPRSARLREKERCRVLLGKLLPWGLIPAFRAMHPEIMTLERRSRTESKLWVNLPSIAKALKGWRFDLAGYVGYERAVVTAGGVSAEGVVAKTLESKHAGGLYFCGEVLDIDSDTGGYNLQTAFCTGALAGRSAAAKLLNGKE